MKVQLIIVLQNGETKFHLRGDYGHILNLTFPDADVCKEWLALRYDIQWSVGDDIQEGTPTDGRWPSSNIKAFHIVPNTYYGYAERWLDSIEAL